LLVDSGSIRGIFAVTVDTIEFIHELTLSDIPSVSLHHARRCLLDTLGVAAAALAIDTGQIVRAHAAAFHGTAKAGARMLFDGRRVAPPGAAMAGAAMIDSFDAHDGHRFTKGHVGVVVVPAVLAFADEIMRGNAAEFLTRIVLGYEIASRAGVALHATVPEYHTSGAWNSIAAAAIGARVLGFDRETTRHALGIAEYYGPRSQMMRVIDHPSMLKDGSTMGGFAGVSAALLAADGFTGAPAITVEDEAVAYLWDDLGSRWGMDEQYLKPHPVCRWAQPPVEAVMALRDEVKAADVESILIHTFFNAVRLAKNDPSHTEEAQYSTPFPVAAALVHGRLTAAEIDGDGLRDPEVQRLCKSVRLIEDETYTARFPAERWARVELTMKDGRVVKSPPCKPRGDPDEPLPDAEVAAKFAMLAGPALGADRAARISDAIFAWAADSDLDGLMEDLLEGARP
jgi:2-methylcitrate dehydratase PrpD